MLNSKFVGFAAKKVLICCILLSIIVVVLFEERWFALGGLLFGSVLSIVKLSSYAWVFKIIIGASAGKAPKRGGAVKSRTVFALNQILLLPLLYIAYKINIWLFTGFIAGILLVPFVIMINCVTEAVGITRNNFE